MNNLDQEFVTELNNTQLSVFNIYLQKTVLQYEEQLNKCKEETDETALQHEKQLNNLFENKDCTYNCELF